MILESIQRIKDINNNETVDANIYLIGEEFPITAAIPDYPVGLEVQGITLKKKGREPFLAIMPIGKGNLSDMSDELYDSLVSKANLFYEIKDIVSLKGYRHFVSIYETDPYKIFLRSPYTLCDIAIDKYNQTYVAKFEDIDKIVTIKTFEARLEEYRRVARLILQSNEMEGHTYMSYKDFKNRFTNKLIEIGHPMRTGEVSAVLRHFSNEFYLDDYLSNESKVAFKKTRDEEYWIYDEIVNYKTYPTPYMDFDAGDMEGFTEEQKAAVNDAMLTRGRVSIITGGPGTGKTTVLSKIVDTMKEIYPEASIKFLAPTGKASKRIEEVMGNRDIVISTIHKFLGYGYPSVPASVRDEARESDLVIVDESSMMDISITWELFQAINLNRTKVILVGDANQLPSVGAGNILGDLIALGVPTFWLTKNMRNHGHIAQNAERIIHGDFRLEEGEDFEIHSDFTSANSWYTAGLMCGNPDEDIIAISPYRTEKKIESTSSINDISKGVSYRIRNNSIKAYNRNTSKRNRIPELKKFGKFSQGDKVIFVRTNYDADYKNGQTGEIISKCVDKDGNTYLSVAVDNSVISVYDEADLDLAYAITVHKSQGSEYQHVCIVLGKYTKFVTRRMLYTAITRAKSKVTIFAPYSVLRGVIMNNADEKRRTFLSYRANTQLKSKFA